MRWIPGGSFAMGSDDFYPEERPVHRVSVDGFWMDESPVTATQFRRFVRETNYVTLAERPLEPALYPDAKPELLVPAHSCSAGRRGRWIWTTIATGGSTCRGPAGDDPGKGYDRQRPRHAPCGPDRVRRRRGVCRVGREGAAERGGVGVRRARRARGRGLRLGRRPLPGRQADGEHVAGRVPLAEPETRRIRGDLAGRQLRAQRATASTTWPATPGSGRPTGSRPGIRTRCRVRAASHETLVSRHPSRAPKRSPAG